VGVKKYNINLTPQPPSLPGKGESKPLPSQGRGLERGFIFNYGKVLIINYCNYKLRILVIIKNINPG
jgi:hypothetical protein